MLRDQPQPSIGREPLLALSSAVEGGGLELRVNFGVFSGREVTAAEIDDLGRQLVERVESVTIVSELSHEIGPAAHATVHQVLIRIGPDAVRAASCELGELRGRLLEVTERWAQACIADRHDPLADDISEPPS